MTAADTYLKKCKQIVATPNQAFLDCLKEQQSTYTTPTNELDSSAVTAVCSSLDLCRSLTTLRLTGLTLSGRPMLSTQTLTTAMGSVRGMPKLRVLDLSNNALDDSIASKPIATLLTQNSTLAALILKSNNLSHTFARELLSRLASNSSLTEIDTSDNLQLHWSGQADDYERLFKEQNATITAFGASLKPEPLTKLVMTWYRNPSRMRRVALTTLPLTESAIATICSWLSAKQCGLTDLDLTGACSDRHGARLAKALQSNSSLVRFTFARNQVGTSAGIAIAEALRVNVTLTHVSLAGNALMDAAAVALPAALAGNKSMASLDLSRNSIGAIGAQALRQALHQNQSMTSLGALDSLPIAISLRTSLEWYLRQNAERLEAMSAEADASAQQQGGLLKLLPESEQALRRQVFALEEEAARLKTAFAQVQQTNQQVGSLLEETIKRNVATRLPALSSAKAKKKKKKSSA